MRSLNLFSITLIATVHIARPYSVPSHTGIRSRNFNYLRTTSCPRLSRKTLQLSSTDITTDNGYPVFPKELDFMNTDTSKRLLPWVGFASLCLIFQSFYPIIVGTFFLSVMGNSIVDSMSVAFQKVSDRLNMPRFKMIPRKLFVVVYFVFLCLGLVRFMLLSSPRIIKESTYVLQLLQSEDPYTLAANLFLSTFGVEVATRVESALIEAVGASRSSLAGLNQSRRLSKLIQDSATGYLQNFLVFTSKIISDSTSAAYKGVLSLIFSLMVRSKDIIDSFIMPIVSATSCLLTFILMRQI